MALSLWNQCTVCQFTGCTVQFTNCADWLITCNSRTSNVVWASYTFYVLLEVTTTIPVV